MTGRITDAYTNINTVKLFAHTRREADHAKTRCVVSRKPATPRCA